MNCGLKGYFLQGSVLTVTKVLWMDLLLHVSSWIHSFILCLPAGLFAYVSADGNMFILCMCRVRTSPCSHCDTRNTLCCSAQQVEPRSAQPGKEGRAERGSQLDWWSQLKGEKKKKKGKERLMHCICRDSHDTHMNSCSRTPQTTLHRKQMWRLQLTQLTAVVVEVGTKVTRR